MGREVDEGVLAAERRRKAVQSLSEMCSEDYESARLMAHTRGEPEPDREAFVDAWIKRTNEAVAGAADDSRWV